MEYIVCSDRAGLGNRLKGLISAIRLSKVLGRELLLYWEKNKYCNCAFNDLFENKFHEIGKNELNRIKKLNSKVYRDVLDKDYGKYEYIILDTWKFIFLPGEIPENFGQVYSSEKGSNIDFEFMKIPLEIRGKLLSELISLRIKKDIREIIEEFSEKNNVKNLIGLHIRRGDNWITPDGREKVSSDERFIELIKSMPEERFLLCTDGEDTEEKFKEMFGERIITYPKGDRKRNRPEALKEALIDMVLLSKTKHIYGSYLSTFSEVAWWFSGCRVPITIVGEENVKKSPKPRNLWERILRKTRSYKVIFLRNIRRSYG